MESFRLVLAAFTSFALVYVPVCTGEEITEMENAEVLQMLADYDSIFMSGFTVSGKQQADELIVVRAPLLKGVNRKWRFAFGGDRVTYRLEMIDYPKPKYEDLEKAEVEIDEKKTRSVVIKTEQWGYWGDDVSGNHYESTVLRLAPTGEIAENGKMFKSMLWGPTAAGPIAPKRILLWSLGRFFSKQLDKVTRVEKSPNGHLFVSALGTQSPGYKGRWDLEIEPAAAWMVRTARFYWDGAPDRIEAEMKNDGTVWSGPYCIPKTAACNYWGALGVDQGPVQITFEPVVEPFDDKLYADARQAVVDNRTPELTLIDYRVSPRVISEPNRPMSEPDTSEPKNPLASATSTRFWIIIINLILLGLLVCYVIFCVIFRRKLSSATGSTVQ